jgi:hypothetical protein
MRRLRLLLVGLVMALGGAALAQSPGVGVYTGFPTYLGVQFQTGNLRLGAGLDVLGIGADGALILDKNSLGTGEVPLAWYYGVGLGAGLYFGGSFFLYPHGLIGLEFPLPGANVTPYLESQVGVGVVVPVFFPFPIFSGRVGVIFR